MPQLEEEIRKVVDTLAPDEREVRDQEGRWYSLRVRPYRTSENRIDGAVLQLIDVDELKQTLEQVRSARDYAAAIVETVREPLLVLGAELRIETANRSFFKRSGASPEESLGSRFTRWAEASSTSPGCATCSAGGSRGIQRRGRGDRARFRAGWPQDDVVERAPDRAGWPDRTDPAGVRGRHRAQARRRGPLPPAVRGGQRRHVDSGCRNGRDHGCQPIPRGSARLPARGTRGRESVGDRTAPRRPRYEVRAGAGARAGCAALPRPGC